MQVLVFGSNRLGWQALPRVLDGRTVPTSCRSLPSLFFVPLFFFLHCCRGAFAAPDLDRTRALALPHTRTHTRAGTPVALDLQCLFCRSRKRGRMIYCTSHWHRCHSIPLILGLSWSSSLRVHLVRPGHGLSLSISETAVTAPVVRPSSCDRQTG